MHRKRLGKPGFKFWLWHWQRELGQAITLPRCLRPHVELVQTNHAEVEARQENPQEAQDHSALLRAPSSSWLGVAHLCPRAQLLHQSLLLHLCVLPVVQQCPVTSHVPVSLSFPNSSLLLLLLLHILCRSPPHCALLFDHKASPPFPQGSCQAFPILEPAHTSPTTPSMLDPY